MLCLTQLLMRLDGVDQMTIVETAAQEAMTTVVTLQTARVSLFCRLGVCMALIRSGCWGPALVHVVTTLLELSRKKRSWMRRASC